MAEYDPILSTIGEQVWWDLKDGSPMPPPGARFVVVEERFETSRDERANVRTITRVRLATHADGGRTLDTYGFGDMA